MNLRACPCGSSHPRRELIDAMGIFCTFVCDACEPAKRREFDPAIFDPDTYPRDEDIYGDGAPPWERDSEDLER